jgi:hypothetical protein
MLRICPGLSHCGRPTRRNSESKGIMKKLFFFGTFLGAIYGTPAMAECIACESPEAQQEKTERQAAKDLCDEFKDFYGDTADVRRDCAWLLTKEGLRTAPGRLEQVRQGRLEATLKAEAADGIIPALSLDTFIATAEAASGHCAGARYNKVAADAAIATIAARRGDSAFMQRDVIEHTKEFVIRRDGDRLCENIRKSTAATGNPYLRSRMMGHASGTLLG